MNTLQLTKSRQIKAEALKKAQQVMAKDQRDAESLDANQPEKAERKTTELRYLGYRYSI
ncbi:hypothetical protein [Synechococcus sp. PROS-7-1]|uniref:hypothetical protein n=1 Tax=Synechococcus sp. PROS-7-1 TaxID=1442556 RepID=UPI001648398E|nr:hypothetical protein [Synechococcus sp. PROS-7-1]